MRARMGSSRSPRQASSSHGTLAVVSRSGTAHADYTTPFSFDAGKMELIINGLAVKVYSFADAPEMPWFQAKPIVTFLCYTTLTQILESQRAVAACNESARVLQTRCCFRFFMHTLSTQALAASGEFCLCKRKRHGGKCVRAARSTAVGTQRARRSRGHAWLAIASVARASRRRA